MASNRVRHMSTEHLVRLVAQELVDVQLDPYPSPQRARRFSLYARELRRRNDAELIHPIGCFCAECLAELVDELTEDRGDEPF